MTDELPPEPVWDEPAPQEDAYPPDEEWLPPADLDAAFPAVEARPVRPAHEVCGPSEATRAASQAGTTAERALTVLRRLVGADDARFHDGQLEAVLALVERRQRALVVQRTGWGKSAVYFVATALRRAEGAGPTVIVSPLLALMRDQIAAAERAGVRAVTMNSANATEWAEVSAALAADDVDVLLISPERLNNPAFRAEQLPDLAARCGLLVVDEAHCISDWGHDFRPDYRRIKDLLAELPSDTPVLATTATANERVVADVAEQLRGGGGTDGAGGAAAHEVLTIRGPLARDSLRLGVLQLPYAETQLAWLCAHLGDFTGSGIIYTLTVSAADDVARALTDAGYAVRPYTGRTDAAEREQLEDALRRNELKALVATSALGMGFDKPDLGFVIHLGAPSSPVAYYQHVGRAGRGATNADVLLLPSAADRDIWHYFATASMPDQAQATAVLEALASSSKPLSTAALETQVDIRRTRLELLLKVLDVDGAVQRVKGGWASTGRPWAYDAARYARVAEAREREQQLMLDYCALRPAEDGSGADDRCRMAFLTDALDDPASHACGRCDVCAGPWYDPSLPQDAVAVAKEALDRPGVLLEPRAQWPTGMDRLGAPVKGRIADAPETGRVLGRLSDLGIGQRLRTLFAQPDGPVPDDVLRACIPVLRDWDWAVRPVAVAAVPSRRRGQLVSSLADGLARLGRMQPLGNLDLVDGGPVGEAGGNSAFRLAGVWGRLAVGPRMMEEVGLLNGPILLVDDLVDSRWTMTVAAVLLRQAGADAVLPFALGQQG